jgi:small subunit ribosomal protein S6
MVSEEVLNKEQEQLPDYELVFIISPEVVEDRINEVTESVSQFITGKGGIVSEVEQWGKRRLAYPIKHFEEGSYILVRFKMQPGYNRELETNLRISEDILRHLLIKLT